MTSQVLAKAIDKIDDFLDQQNSGLPHDATDILNDLTFIEQKIAKNWHTVQHLMHVRDLIRQARVACGS